VQAIIARSFGYIFSRNYQNFSLIGIKLEDDEFYKLAPQNTDVTINMKGRTVEVGGKTFRFNMSLFEERLLAGGGIMPLYKKFGNRLFRVAVQDPADISGGCKVPGSCDSNGKPTKSIESSDMSW
jgi:homoaconitate hydratase